MTAFTIEEIEAIKRVKSILDSKIDAFCDTREHCTTERGVCEFISLCGSTQDASDGISSLLLDIEVSKEQEETKNEEV